MNSAYERLREEERELKSRIRDLKSLILDNKNAISSTIIQIVKII
jgi:hypothetical protein